MCGRRHPTWIRRSLPAALLVEGGKSASWRLAPIAAIVLALEPGLAARTTRECKRKRSIVVGSQAARGRGCISLDNFGSRMTEAVAIARSKRRNFGMDR